MLKPAINVLFTDYINRFMLLLDIVPLLVPEQCRRVAVITSHRILHLLGNSPQVWDQSLEFKPRVPYCSSVNSVYGFFAFITQSELFN